MRNPNYIQIPKTKFVFKQEDIAIFNRVYQDYIVNSPIPLQKIKRTPSGGIKVMPTFRSQYDIIETNNSIELTLIIKEGCYRFIVGAAGQNDLSGGAAFNEFKKICKKHGISIDAFSISNGEEIKKTIERPHIESTRNLVYDRIYTNVHHLDLNSAYFSGIMDMYPSLAGPIKEIYNKRKIDKICKDILTHTYGYMQSKYCVLRGRKYALAHLSKAAVAYCNRYIEQLAAELENSGRKVLLYNTDGIWYQGDVYHNECEGGDLGEWKNDHVNCKFRAKSKGAYEFMENGIYHPVIRGYTRLDRLKPRELWDWGDIYQEDARIVEFKWDVNKGIIIRECDSYEQDKNLRSLLDLLK